MKVLGKIDIEPLLRAYSTFQSGLSQAQSDLEKAGAIQYFEFTFELAWKTMKRVLAEQGTVLNSPKTVIREAGIEGLIRDTNAWFEFTHNRNNTVHSYNVKTAQEIFDDLPKFNDEMEFFVAKLKSLK